MRRTVWVALGAAPGVFAYRRGQRLVEEARANGARLSLTALVDQFYAEVQAMGGNRWDTSSLKARLKS